MIQRQEVFFKQNFKTDYKSKKMMNLIIQIEDLYSIKYKKITDDVS